MFCWTSDLHGDKQAGIKLRSSSQPDPAAVRIFIFGRFATEIGFDSANLTAPYGLFTQALRPTTDADQLELLLISEKAHSELSAHSLSESTLLQNQKNRLAIFCS